jgi:hypothetical protein
MKLFALAVRGVAEAKRNFVMPANAGIQVTDSVRHTVEKRGDDNARMAEIRVDSRRRSKRSSRLEAERRWVSCHLERQRGIFLEVMAYGEFK